MSTRYLARLGGFGRACRRSRSARCGSRKQSGRIAGACAQRCAGYWNKPEATSQTFTGGWLHTGDLARIDAEGFVQIVDRKKDMVNRGGENVYSVEVENALAAHPAVFESAVIGVPDAMMGEKVGRGNRPQAGTRGGTG